MSYTNSMLNIKDKSHYESYPETFIEFSIITTGVNNFIPLGSSYTYITSIPPNIKTNLLEDDISPHKSIFKSSKVKHLMRRIPPEKTNYTSYNSCTEST